eukprot:TRINITY_DN2388_c0_g1_i1.p1 TRINITY_DN2388_c0_g1~~TRINITY_DN2388_c0_g1_i1.p1  ORF type:complete len:384 (-),score=71.20 TRINITY_DN2388_c0_g1_i1:591-1742(-)
MKRNGWRSFWGSVLILLSLWGLASCEQQELQSAADKQLIVFNEPTVRLNLDILSQKVDNLDKTLPFNGFVLRLSETYTVFKAGVTLDSSTEEQIRTSLGNAFLVPNTNSQLKLKQLINNWVLVDIENPGSMYDDDAWNRVANNWKVLAKAIKDTMVGIMYDNEEYDSKWSDSYPVKPLYSDPTQLYAYTNKTFERGMQIMNAVLEVWPEVKVIFLHGPYTSAPGTPAYVIRNQVGDWNTDSNILRGAFFAGFLNAIYQSGNTQAELIDGGEVYQYRTLSDFQNSYQWRKYGIADDPQTWFIPTAELRAFWKQRVSISFGTYNRSWPSKKKDKMDPKIMKSALANALTVADKWVWYYEEKTNFLLGTTPKEWKKAVIKALASVQ